MMAQVLTSLPPTREAQIEFWLLAVARPSPSCYRHLGINQSLPLNEIFLKRKKTKYSGFTLLCILRFVVKLPCTY